MGVRDELDQDGTTSGSSAMARVERAPWALNAPSYIGSGDLYNPALSDPRSGYWTMEVSGSERNAEGLWGALPVDTRREIDRLAKQYHPNSTGESLWNKAISGSAALTEAGKPTTAFEWLSGYAEQYGGSAPSGGSTGSRGSGGYSGPVSTTTFMDDRDVDRTANALALELIGRPLSQKELAKVTKRLRSEESANPTITTPSVGSSVTQSGLSAEGRADVLREVIAENPEYQQFQVDTTVLDTMLSELNKREQMVNGR